MTVSGFRVFKILDSPIWTHLGVLQPECLEVGFQLFQAGKVAAASAALDFSRGRMIGHRYRNPIVTHEVLAGPASLTNGLGCIQGLGFEGMNAQ